MNARVEHLLREFLALSDQDRAALAAAVINSLEDEDSISVASAWKQELRQRRDELLAGTVKAEPWAQARARMSAM